eukprot:403332557
MNPLGSEFAQNIQKRIGLYSDRETKMRQQLHKIEQSTLKMKQKRPQINKESIIISSQQEIIDYTKDEAPDQQSLFNQKPAPQTAGQISGNQRYLNIKQSQNKRALQTQNGFNLQTNQQRVAWSPLSNQTRDPSNIKVKIYEPDKQQSFLYSKDQNNEEFSHMSSSRLFLKSQGTQQEMLSSENSTRFIENRNKSLFHKKGIIKMRNQIQYTNLLQQDQNQNNNIMSTDQIPKLIQGNQYQDIVINPQIQSYPILYGLNYNLTSTNSLISQPRQQHRIRYQNQLDDEFSQKLDKINMSQSYRTNQLNSRSLQKLLNTCKEFEREECFKKIQSGRDILHQMESQINLIDYKSGVVQSQSANTSMIGFKQLVDSKSQNTRSQIIKEKIKLWSKRFKSTEEEELKDLRKLQREQKQNQQLLDDKEIFDNITVLQKHLIPTHLLKRLRQATCRNANQEKHANFGVRLGQNLGGADLNFSYQTPSGALMFRESSILKLCQNDTKVEEVRIAFKKSIKTVKHCKEFEREECFKKIQSGRDICTKWSHKQIQQITKVESFKANLPNTSMIGFKQLVDSKSQNTRSQIIKEKIKLWSKRFKSTEEEELKDLRKLQREQKQNQQLLDDKEIFDNITVLQKHLIPTHLLKRLRQATCRNANQEKHANFGVRLGQNLGGADLNFSYQTPSGALMFRESSILKLCQNDTSKYEESADDVLKEYKEYTKMSDLVSSRKYKFKKFISNRSGGGKNSLQGNSKI